MTYSDSVIDMGELRDRVKIYFNGNTKYTCDSLPGTQLTDKAWKIRRQTRNPGDRGTETKLANGGEYNLQATDLTTVENYTYA